MIQCFREGAREPIYSLQFVSVMLFVSAASKPDKVVGLIALKVDGSGSELKRMFVREDYRGCGIGLLLAETLLDHVRRIRIHQVSLIVTNSRKGAIKFYEKIGFEKSFSFKIDVGWIRFLPIILTGIQDIKYVLEIN